jgi:SAM-dependent methyltransferase
VHNYFAKTFSQRCTWTSAKSLMLARPLSDFPLHPELAACYLRPNAEQTREPAQGRGAVGIYANFIHPNLCHLAMRSRRFVPFRERIAGAARGHVLEIGIGSGLNLPFYRGEVCSVAGIEPSMRLIAMARRLASVSPLRAALIQGSAELIPLDDKSIDTIVSTFTLCSINKVLAALAEMRRVLKPEGRLLFLEHGLAPDPSLRRWQVLLAPVWKRAAGGCELTRPIDKLIEDSGFKFDWLKTGYMTGPKPMTFLYEGSAKPY